MNIADTTKPKNSMGKLFQNAAKKEAIDYMILLNVICGAEAGNQD